MEVRASYSAEDRLWRQAWRRPIFALRAAAHDRCSRSAHSGERRSGQDFALTATRELCNVSLIYRSIRSTVSSSLFALVRAVDVSGNCKKSRMNREDQSFAKSAETHRMFHLRRTKIHKASRSKSVAEGNVGSLLCVDRLGSNSCDPAAMSMNESRHSSAARQTVQQHRQSGRPSTSLFHRSYLAGDRAASFGREPRRARELRSLQIGYAPPPFVTQIELPNASVQQSAYEMAPRRIARAARYDRG